jgi:hypothetical protein
MLGHVEHIEQDILSLEAKTTAIAQDFRGQYDDYLTALRQAVRYQLGSLCHYLCTQIHPESFLKLRFAQRQDLLSHLQLIIQQADRQLNLDSLLHTDPATSPNDVSAATDRDRSSFRSSTTPDSNPTPADPTAFNRQFELDNELISDELLIDELDYEDLDNYEDLVNEFAPPAEPRIELRLDQAPTLPEIARDTEDLRPETPAGQLHWQESLERNIVQVLRSLSQSTTQLLDDANILSSPLPDPSNDSAETTEIVNNPPNLVSLVMESKGRDKKRKPESRMQIVAIYLRLADLEFQDTALMTRRNSLRTTQQRLQSLAQDYKKRLRDRSIGQAEALWQASWPIAAPNPQPASQPEPPIADSV